MSDNIDIEQILSSLPKERREELLYAFEYGIGQYVRLPFDTFVGVNCEYMDGLNIEHREGTWCYGHIKLSDNRSEK